MYGFALEDKIIGIHENTCIFKDYLIDMKNKCREMLGNCRKNSYHFNVKFFDIWTFCFSEGISALSYYGNID